jgi:hypothetical protein
MSVNDGDVVTLDVTVHHGALLGASALIGNGDGKRVVSLLAMT